MSGRVLSDMMVLSTFVLLGLAFIAFIYTTNIGFQPTPTIKYASTTTLAPETTTTTITATSTTTPPTTIIGKTADAIVSATSDIHTTSTITTTSTTAASTTTVVTQPAQPSYLAKYTGRGYHQAYMEITFFCPSCVPAVAANLRAEPGVIAKDMSYKQKISRVVYNPKRITLQKVLGIAGGSGEVVLISDSEI